MVEWRPLLITPELSGLLHRTRITLIDSPAITPELPPVELVSATDELTLPRPARLPSAIVQEPAPKPAIATIAPLAMDVEAPPPQRGRSLELVAVAATAFALAWIGHAKLHPQPSSAAAAPLTPVAMAAPACAPAPSPTARESSAIPTVAIADLPLVGATSAVAAPGTTTLARAGVRHPRSTNASGGPSRAELLGALSQVAQAGSSCGERGGPVRVVVSFASSGVARSIQVSGADLPAPTRSCLIRAASRARVAAFSGEPVTVAKTL